jgi:drug/metabolite transporter (DMT)-like permease
VTRPGRASALAVGALALLWGSNFLWIKVALDGLSPVQITLTRLATGAAVLVAVVYARGARLPSDRGTVAHLAVAALFANAAPYLLFALGEQHVDSARAGVLSATTPLWTVLVAVAAGQERGLGPARLAGIAVGFAGALVVLQPWASGPGGSVAGQAACLAAAGCYGVSYVYMARFLTPRGLSPLVLAAGQLVAATLWLLPALAVAGSGPVDATPAVLGAMLALGPLGTGVAYVLNYTIVARDGPTAASVVTYLLPVVAVALGALVLDETLTLAIAAGTAVILAGVALARRRSADTEPTTPAPSAR